MLPPSRPSPSLPELSAELLGRLERPSEVPLPPALGLADRSEPDVPLDAEPEPPRCLPSPS